MKIKLAVFDFDGTLVSSHKTIYKAMIRTLKELNINAEIPEKEFYNMIGLHFEDLFKEFGFSKEIIYLPNPFLPENKIIASTAADEKYILYFGRLSEEKGIADLLCAYAKLKTEVKLRIVGNGPQEEELKKIVAEEKISQVEFVGYKTGEDLWQQVAGAEFIVVPSRWYENAPYTVIEAMAAGKIVLAASIGGLTELIDEGKSGFLFAAGDVENLFAKLEFILSHPELKDSIGAQAIASLKEKNDPEKYYQALYKIYEQVRGV